MLQLPGVVLLIVLIFCSGSLLQADEAGSKVRVQINPLGAQQLLESDPRATLNGPPFRLSPRFELIDSITRTRASLKLSPQGFWVFEFDLPADANPRVLHRLLLSPLPDVGGEAIRALRVLQELWAESDLYPLVHEAPAWASGTRDPRYDENSGLIVVTFPPLR